MAVYVNTTAHIAVNEGYASCHADQVEVNGTADELDVTTYCGNGWRRKILGLGAFTVAMEGPQDFTSPGPGFIHPGTSIQAGDLSTFSVSFPGSTAGDVAYFGQCRKTQITDLSGDVGAVARYTLGAAGTSRLVRGALLHPYAARTATGNGTSVAFTPPTADQSLHAAFHVHEVAGTGTITFVVATDDNSGFTTGTTRITSSAFAAIGHQFSSLAGALAGETHVRVQWTISGFTSVTFSVAVGVGVA